MPRGSLVGDFWSSYGQRKATTGRGLTSSEMMGLTRGMYDAWYDKQTRMNQVAEQRRQFEKQMDMRRAEQQAQERGATAQGVVNLAGAYGQYKVGMAQAQALAGGAGGQGVGLAGGGGIMMPGPAGAAPGTAASLPMAGNLPTTGAPTTGLGAGMFQQAATYAGPALAGLGAGSLVSQGLLGKESEVVQAGGGVAAGALAGFVSSGFNPIGALVGGALGGLSSLADDVSVICSALQKQGLLDSELWSHSNEAVISGVIDRKTYWAYRKVFDRFVPYINKYKVVAYMFIPIGKGLAKECAHRMFPEKYKGSYIGKAIELFLKGYIKYKEYRNGTR